MQDKHDIQNQHTKLHDIICILSEKFSTKIRLVEDHKREIIENILETNHRLIFVRKKTVLDVIDKLFHTSFYTDSEYHTKTNWTRWI